MITNNENSEIEKSIVLWMKAISSCLDLKTVNIGKLGFSLNTSSALLDSGIDYVSDLVDDHSKSLAINIHSFNPESRQDFIDKIFYWIFDNLDSKDFELVHHEDESWPFEGEKASENIQGKRNTRPFMIEDSDEIRKNIIFWIKICQLYNKSHRHLGNKHRKPFLILPLSEAEGIIALLLCLNSRGREIIIERLGLFTGKEKTLSDVSKIYRMSEEKIRQLEGKTLREIRSMKQYYQPIVELMARSIRKYDGFMTNQQMIKILKDYFKDVKLIPESILNCFRYNIFPIEREEIVYLRNIDGWSTNDFSEEQLEFALRIIIEEIKKFQTPWYWKDLLIHLSAAQGKTLLSENLAHEVLKTLLDNKLFIRLPNGQLISSCNFKSTQQRLVFVLQQIGHPVHFEEITKFYNGIFVDKQLVSHTLHSILLENSQFTRVGQGSYGLLEWGLFPDGNIANAVFRILTQADHPLKLNVIIQEVKKTWQVSDTSILMAMERDNRFNNTPNGWIHLP